MNYLSLLSDGLVLNIIGYLNDKKDLSNLKKLNNEIYNNLNWRSLFSIKYPLINFKEGILDINFNSNKSIYYMNKYSELNTIYIKWLYNINDIKTFIKDGWNRVIEQYTDIKIEELTQDDIDTIDITYATQYKGHIPNIEIFKEFDPKIIELINKITNPKKVIIVIYNMFNKYMLRFHIKNNSYINNNNRENYFDFDITEKQSYNLRLYFLYNNIDEYVY